MPRPRAVGAVSDADAERLDVAERARPDEGGLRDAYQSGLTLDLGGGAGAVSERAGQEGLCGAGLRAVVRTGLGEGLHVRGEDGFAPSDGDVFGSGKHEGDGGGVVAHGGAEGYEEAAIAGAHEGGGEDDGGEGQAVLHGGDGSRVVLRGVVGKGDDGRAGAGSKRVEHAEYGGEPRPVHGGEVLHLVDNEEGGFPLSDVVGEPSHDLVEAGPGRGELRAGCGGRPEGVAGGSLQADRLAAAGNSYLVAVVVEQVLDVIVVLIIVVVLEVVRAVIVVGRVVGVVIDGVRGREEVCKVDAVEVGAEVAERGEDVGLRVAVERSEGDGSGGERGVRLIGGSCAS